MTWSEVSQSKEEMISRAIRAAFLNIDEVIGMDEEGINPHVKHDVKECLKVVDDANKFLKSNGHEEIRMM